MADSQDPQKYRQLDAIGRAAMGIAGVVVSVSGGIGGFANLRLLAVDLSSTDQGLGALLTPIAIYHAAWLLFFAGLLAAGISLMVSTVKGRREDIIPGPSLYVMGVSLVIAGMVQLLFGRPELAAATALAGIVLMVVEYRSALI